MSKNIPSKLFFKIGEVCELTDTQPYVLRYWETEFSTLAPAKNNSGQRIYRNRDIETILRIKTLLYEEGFTIAGAKKKIELEIAGDSKKQEPTPSSPAPETSSGDSMSDTQDSSDRDGEVAELKAEINSLLNMLDGEKKPSKKKTAKARSKKK